jgi:hypothetical protein
VLQLLYKPVEFAAGISDAESVQVSNEDIAMLTKAISSTSLFSNDFLRRLKNCEELHRTQIEDNADGNIELLHESEIYVLLINHDGTYIDPSYDKSFPSEISTVADAGEKTIVGRIWDILTGR